jgi:hypothetical protein
MQVAFIALNQRNIECVNFPGGPDKIILLVDFLGGRTLKEQASRPNGTSLSSTAAN